MQTVGILPSRTASIGTASACRCCSTFSTADAYIPGTYASAVLKVEQHRQALAVPIEAVRDGKIPTVCIINQNNELEERAATLGLETATKYEVLSGLQEGDLVTLGNPGGIKPGQKVEAKFASLAAEK